MREGKATAVSLIAVLVAICALAVIAPPASADPPTGGTTIVGETFTGSSVADPSWTVQGDACLTGAPATGAPPAGSASIPNCSAHRAGGSILPGVGVLPGYLQLTDQSGNARGSILYNKPIPSTAGVSITFDQFQYGGNGADGIGFFLVDGSTSLTVPGGFGGSLGYAQRNDEPGIVGGYLGVGLDAYGNFWNDGEGRGTGCPVGQRSPTTATGPIAPNVISLRGPGSGLIGYCLLGATVPQPVTNPTSPGTTLNGGTGTLRASTLSASLRSVNIQVTPVTVANPIPRVIVQMRYTPTGPWITELNILAPPNTPTTYKFGLSASTGGNNDVHLIRAAQIQSILPLPQLQLAKQVDRTAGTLPAVITPNTVIPYQYTVTNAGSIPVSSLSITDSLIPSANIVCLLTTLQPAPALGSTTTCKGSYTVTTADAAAGQVDNTATASATSTGGPVVSPPAAVSVPLTTAITLTKSVVTPPPYSIGQQVGYQFVVRNTGGSTLTTFSVTDNRIAAGGVICPQPQLLPGADMTCTGSHPIAASQLNAAGFLVNTATVTASTPLGQTITSVPATATIPVATDVGITKTVDDQTPVLGSNVVFTLTTTNHGPSAATGVVVTDLIPNFGPDTRLEYVSSAPAAGTTYNALTGAWTIGGLAVNASVVLTITASVHSTTAITNSATRTATDQIDINSANDNASVTLNPVVPTADLAVTKTVIGNSTVPIGAPATFRVTVQNLGPFPSSNVAVQDTLPATLDYDSAASSGDGSYDPATGLWTVGSLAVGQVATRDFVVSGNNVDTYTNLAVTTGDSTPPDRNPSNNSDSASITVRPPIADLAIVKNVFPQTATVGDTVTYQMQASNLGPETALNVSVDDLLPPGVTVTAATVDRGTIDLATGTWTIGTMAPGDELLAVLTATVIDGGTQVNTATIRSPIVTDPVPDNNSSSATLTTAQPTVDIGVTKSLNILRGDPPTRVPLGSTVDFTLTATNHPLTTPATATNVLLRDLLPSNFTFVSATGAGTYDPVTGDWTVGTLAPGESAILVIRAIASSPGHTTNTVGLVSLTESDADPTNNSDSVDMDIQRLADLAIQKSVTPTVARPGQSVVYSITVTNNGPNDSLQTFAYDPLMLHAVITGETVPPGTTFDPTTRIWTIGALANGASVVLQVDVQVVLDGWFQNQVVVDDNVVFNPVLDNNVATTQLQVPKADIEITKSVNTPQSHVGDRVTFTVGATNLGPDPAGQVDVTDLLPAGLTLVSATPTAGVYDPVTGVWSIPDVQPIAPPPAQSTPQNTLTIVATVDTVGTLTNTASSDRSASTPFDPNLANNAQSAVVVADPRPATLTLEKSVSPASAAIGATVRFTLLVTNAGPGDAENVVVNDPMPAGIAPLSADSGCTITGQTVHCLLGTLAAGDSVTITVRARLDGPGVLTNVASSTTTSPNPDPGAGTAAAEVTVTPLPSDGEGSSGVLSATGSNPAGVFELAVLSLTAGFVMLVIAGSRRRRTERP